MQRAVPILAAALLLAGGCKKPEASLAKHAEALTGIVESHLESPKEGIQALRDYWHDNFPEIAELLGKMVVELDRLDGPKREERAKEMMAALATPVAAFVSAFERFAKEVEKDKDARAVIEDLGASYVTLGEALGPALRELVAGVPREKNEAVKVFEDAAAAICACKDMDCVEAAKRAFEEGVKGLGDDVQGTDDDKRAIEEAGKRVAECTIRIATAKAPGAAGGSER